MPQQLNVFLFHRNIISQENHYIMHDYHATKMPWQLVQRATAAAQSIKPQKHPTTPPRYSFIMPQNYQATASFYQRNIIQPG